MPEPKSNRGGRVWGLYQQGVKDRGREGEIGDIWDIEEGRRERRKAEARESLSGSELIGGIGADRRAQSRFDEDGRSDRASLQRVTRDGDGRPLARHDRASLQRATRGEDVVLQGEVERVPHSPLDPRKKGLELARLSDTPSGVWLGRPWGSSTLDVLSGRGEDKGAKMLQTLAGGDFTFGGRGRGAGGNEWSYRKSEEGEERDVFGAQMDRIARETERMSGKAFAESRAREDADRRANPISYGLRALSGRYGRDTIDAVAGSSDEEKTLYATNRVLGDYKNDRRLVERVVSGKDRWLSRMGKTFWDDMDGGMKLLDFGVEDAVTTRAITLAMAKFEKVGREGLSQAERNLLDAVAVRDTYRAFYEEQLGDNWSGAGRVTAEALPFVRDMVLGGGLSGTARGAAGGAAKAGAKEAAKGAVRRYLGEWLKKAPGQIAGTLFIEMPRVASDTEERMHGRLVATSLDGWDSDNVGFGGHREGAEKSRGVAFAKSLGNQAIEVVSETLGEPVMKVLGLAGRAVFKPLAKSGVGKAVGGAVSELGAKLGSRPTARAVGRFYTGAKRTLAPMREMTRVGGFAEEFLEEQVGGTANALLIGDQSMSDVWGLSGMEQTAVALLPMQVAFGGVGAVGSTARLVQVNGAVRRSAESLRVNGGDVDALQGRLRACSYVELEEELLSRHTRLEDIVSRLSDDSLGVEERLGLEGDARRVGAEMRYVSNWMSREMLVGASESDIEEARGKLESDLESRRRAVLEEEWAHRDVLVHRDDAGDVVDYEVVEVTYGPNDAKGYLVSGAVRDGKVCLEDGSGGAVVVRGADGRVQVHSDDVRVARVIGRDAVDQGVQAKVVADMEGRMQAVSGMMDAYEQGVLELSRDDVEGVVRDVMGRLGVEVPWRVMSREEVEAEGGKLDGSERGWYDEQSGEVVILSDGVSRKSVEHTVLHEVVGHRGLAALFDRKALYDYFDEVWESMSAGDREEIARLYPGLSTSDLASEYIAHQAETYSNPGVWARIVAGFRRLLDGLGLSLKVSDGDIRMMLSRGVRAMQKGRESEVSEGIGANRSESEPSGASGASEGTEAQSERPNEESSGLDGDGRSDRASLQRATRGASAQRATRDRASVQRATREGSGVGVGSRIRWRDEASGEVRGGKIVGVVDSDLYMVLPDGSDSPVSVGRDLVIDDFGSIAPWGLSDEVDGNGSPFVLSPNGTESFGAITEEMSRASGLPSGEVRLPLGGHDASNNKGSGAIHIEHNHGDQIREAGFSSVAEFVASVFGNVTEIRRGKVRDDGRETYLVVSRSDRGQTVFVEFEAGDGYWVVNSAGSFRLAYIDKKELLWSAVPALGIDSATESQEDVETQVGYPDSPTTRSGNSTEKAPSSGKGSKSVEDKQGEGKAEESEVPGERSGSERIGGNRNGSEPTDPSEPSGASGGGASSGSSASRESSASSSSSGASETRGGVDAQIERPYEESSSGDGDGRSDRASLQRATREEGAGASQELKANSQEQDETARDVVERGVRKRRYRRRREADAELMGRKLSPTERAFVGRMERLRERYGQSVSLDAGGTMWGLSGVMDNSLVQRRERVKTEWVDATNPIRVYEERVGALSGRPVEGSRSVWMRYNQTSSRATSKIEELEGGVYRRLAQKLREVSRRLGLTGEQLDDYLFAKHAPERNAYMRQRGVEQRLAKLDAKHADDPLWLDSSERRKAEAKYKAKEAELEYAYETQLGEDIPEHFAGHELLDGVEGVADLVEQFEEAMRSRGLSVEELWEAVRAVNDAILVVWRDCGMMSQEAYEAVSGMYEWYVPMQGFAEESRGDYEYMHDHVGGFVQPIQRAKGRVSRPDRPLLAMYRKIRSAVIGGYHNVEKQAFYGLVSNYPSDYTSLGRQYYSVGEDGLLTPMYPSSFASEDIEEFEDRMREGLADGTVTLIRERGARVAYLTDARSLGEHVVKVMIGGREHLVFVNGRPDLAQAVNRINVGEDTDVERFAKGLLRGMAQNVTSRNPNFMIVNLLRDAQMSLAVNFLKRGGVYTRAYMRNYLRVSPLILGRIWGKGHAGVGVSREVDAYWEEFKRYGGQTGYARLLSEHKARRRVNSLLDAGGKGRAVRVGEDVLNIFARPNEMIESWGRFATYVTSREMGRSVTESISDAKEVSVNFNRKGAGRSGLYRLIGACQMFFNAGVQGMNLAYGVAVENPWGSSAVVASLMVLGYAVAALQDGDDDHGDVYRAINPAVRKSNVCFVVDKDSYVKVPLAIEMRAFYGMGQELYGLVSGKQDAVEAVLGSMDSMGEIVAYNPTNGASPLAGMVEGQRRGESVGSSLYRGGRGFVPAQIQPITDLLANQNFYGGALRWESRYVDRSLPLYKRLPKHTPEWQVSVSKWINGIGQDKYVSEWRHGVLSPLSDPLVYSYLCSQYFGGIVQMLDQVDRAVAADGVRGAVSASPVTNRFYRYDDSLRGRGIEERFWELRREVESRSKVQRGMRESLEGARSMREYDARSRAIVEYGGGVDYEMLEGWFKDFDKLYKEYKSHRGMLTDEEDRAWRGELQQVEAEMYSEIRGYMMEVRN